MLRVYGSEDGCSTAIPIELDRDALCVAIGLADQALRGSELSRRDYAGLVAQVYQGVIGGMPYPSLLEFARHSVSESSRSQSRVAAAA